jgi:hypothetical protein
MRGAIFREVREEFRPRWAEFYAAKKDGADPETLKELKATLVNEQKAMLDERRDQAYDALRGSREALYQDLLAGQREQRQGLKNRQAIQFDSLDLMPWLHTDIPRDRSNTEREAPRDLWSEATHVAQVRAAEENRPYHFPASGGYHSGMRNGADAGSRLADGFAAGILGLFEVAANAISAPSAPAEKEPPALDHIFAQAAADAHAALLYERERTNAREEEERNARQSARPQQ